MSDKIKITDEVVEVNGKRYVPEGSQKQQNYTGDVRIVVLQRGWIYIGRFSRDGNLCKLHNASCILVWGTTKGLPELVDGKTSKTILDKCEGVVEFDWLTVVLTINVNESKWQEI